MFTVYNYKIPLFIEPKQLNVTYTTIYVVKLLYL